MDKNELLKKQEQIDEKFEKLKKAYIKFIKYIDVNFDFDEISEDEDEFEALWSLDYDNFNFNDGKESREYDNFEHKYWLLQQLWLMLDEIIKGGDDKKAAHRNKKQIELHITDIRRLKHESEAVIEKEKEVICMADDGLKLLDELRNSL